MNIIKASIIASTFFLTIPLSYADTESELNSYDSIFAIEDFYPSHQEDIYSDLSEGETTMESLRFTQGKTYSIAGVCDNDCDDIDLWIYDKYGNLVDSDDDSSDLAILSFRATYSGPYDIKVKMYDCDTSYCFYRVRSYRLED